MNPSLFRTALAASALLLVVPPALAQSNQASSSLEEITVTGKRLEESLPGLLSRQGVRVDTITAQQIAEHNVVDIAQTLRTLAPGLYVSPKNGPFDYIDASFQGSRTSDILWLVDGVRINNRLYAGTTPLDTLPSSIVERIALIEGGQALFYGTEASAGAIDIVTKGFSDTPEGAVTLGGDTNESGHIDGFYSGAFGRSHFLVYGNGDVSAGFRPFREQDFQPSSSTRDRAYRVYTVGGKYAYDFTDDLRASLSYQYDFAKLDYPSPQIVNQAFNDRNEHILSGKIDYTPSDNLQFFAKGYWHDWSSHFTEYDNIVGQPDKIDVSDSHDPWGYEDYGLNLMSKFTLGSSIDAIAGYDFQRYNGSDAVLVIRPTTQGVSAVFGQVATSEELLPNGKVALGVRCNAPDVGQDATVATLSGRYDLRPDLFVRGQIGTAFRLPTAEELFADDPFDERGNPNLKPERSENLNASIGGYVFDHHLKWEVIGFLRNVHDLIDYGGFDPVTEQSLFENVPGTVRVRGGELDLTADFDAVSANLNYTYAHSVQGSGQQIGRVPVDQVKASVDWHPEEQPFSLSATIVYVGDVYRSGLWDGRENYGGYAVVDLAGRVYLDGDRKQTVTLSIANLFDEEYASGIGTARRDSDDSPYTYWNLGQPRTFSARYTLKF
ncbi:MAG TPA: TonB-dependent receptor [Alphaproteobacteria bacterium]|nr:TonB-dependent receptor [Alphaproteobacteria bacterium]